MGWRVPLFGSDVDLEWRASPLVDRPVRVATSDDVEAAFPGALRSAELRAGDPDSALRHARGTVQIMEGQLLETGASPERAREIAVAAARRADGEAVEYRRRN